jgi:hypothetical protein
VSYGIANLETFVRVILEAESLESSVYLTITGRHLHAQEPVRVLRGFFFGEVENLVVGIRGGSCNPSYWEVGI